MHHHGRAAESVAFLAQAILAQAVSAQTIPQSARCVCLGHAGRWAGLSGGRSAAPLPPARCSRAQARQPPRRAGLSARRPLLLRRPGFGPVGGPQVRTSRRVSSRSPTSGSSREAPVLEGQFAASVYWVGLCYVSGETYWVDVVGALLRDIRDGNGSRQEGGHEGEPTGTEGGADS